MFDSTCDPPKRRVTLFSWKKYCYQQWDYGEQYFDITNSEILIKISVERPVTSLCYRVCGESGTDSDLAALWDGTLFLGGEEGGGG